MPVIFFLQTHITKCMKRLHNIKNAWEETPNKGILPPTIKSRMWGNIYKATLSQRTSFHRYAAAVVVAIVLTGGFAFWNGQTGTGELVVTTTFPSDIRLLKLSDGTRIWVNEKTKLTYPETFADDERVVYLEGEAFFDVARDTTRPFKIKSGNILTTVLGTAFNIEAYGKDSAEVNVARGKVRVATIKEGLETATMELTKGDAATYIPQQGLKESKFSAKEYEWKKAILDLDNKNLKEVLEILAMKYGVNFAYRDKGLTDYGLMGTMDTRQSITSVLNSLVFALEGNIKFKQTQEVIWVSAN